MISKETDDDLADVITKLYKIRRAQKADDEALYLLLECRGILMDILTSMSSDY